MPRRASTKKRGDDEGVGSALRVVEEAIGGPLKQEEDRPKNKHAQALSKLGASKGGKARAAKLSDRKRKEIARKAAEARWGKKG
jgi:hypothetical protein